MVSRATHDSLADVFNADPAESARHDAAVWSVRLKRDAAVRTVPEWESLRDLASGIKEHTLSHLADYLEQFERNATARGIQVHWARDAAEHNAIVGRLLTGRGARRVVKSKSMLTEECGLNAHLERAGIEVVDTDLGERIVQLDRKPPSHIVMPAIHMRREEIGRIFHERLGTPASDSDPEALTRAARTDLRTRFLSADAAITGVNFGIASTGGFVVCTNEGNADLGVHCAPMHIASMGIEKLIPGPGHLGVFLRLLARSATGQPITAYTSHFHGPRPGAELHIVIVDNGRSTHLGRDDFWRALKCIRCGACLNTCPVYRRSGGHSYDFVLPGPIGAILAPGRDLERYRELPFASTLCGSCTDVCPVKIDIHGQLYRWRQVIGERGLVPTGKRRALRWFGGLLIRPAAFRRAARVGRVLLEWLPRRLQGAWGQERELPPVPRGTFMEWYHSRRKRS